MKKKKGKRTVVIQTQYGALTVRRLGGGRNKKGHPTIKIAIQYQVRTPYRALTTFTGVNIVGTRPGRVTEGRLEKVFSDDKEEGHQVFSVHTKVDVKPGSKFSVHYGADIDLGIVKGELGFAEFRLRGGLIEVEDVDLS